MCHGSLELTLGQLSNMSMPLQIGNDNENTEYLSETHEAFLIVASVLLASSRVLSDMRLHVQP